METAQPACNTRRRRRMRSVAVAAIALCAATGGHAREYNGTFGVASECGGIDGRPEYSWSYNRQNGSSILDRGLYPATQDYGYLSSIYFLTGLGTESYVEVPLKFPFPFYGKAYDTAYVSQLGYIFFALPAGNETCDGECLSSGGQGIPDPNGPMPAIMPFWGPLGQATVHAGKLDKDTFVFVWEKAQLNCQLIGYGGDCAGSITMELVVYRNGTFEIIVPDVSIHYWDNTLTALRFMIGFQDDETTGTAFCGETCTSLDVLYGMSWKAIRTCQNQNHEIKMALIYSAIAVGILFIIIIILLYNDVGRRTLPCIPARCYTGVQRLFWCIPSAKERRRQGRERRAEKKAKKARREARRARGDSSDSDSSLEKPKPLPDDGLGPYDPQTTTVSPIHAGGSEPPFEEPITV